jgi:anti-sigma B factor antagonist
LLTAPGLRDVIMEHCQDTSTQLIIDLNAVDFLGTGGLAILLEARRQRPDLWLVCTNRRVRLALELAGLGEWFQFRAGVGDAQ